MQRLRAGIVAKEGPEEWLGSRPPQSQLIGRVKDASRVVPRCLLFLSAARLRIIGHCVNYYLDVKPAM